MLISGATEMKFCFFFVMMLLVLPTKIVVYGREEPAGIRVHTHI